MTRSRMSLWLFACEEFKEGYGNGEAEATIDFKAQTAWLQQVKPESGSDKEEIA